MDPRLIRLYNDELRYIREMGAEFAAAFPKIARRLGLDANEVSDPYVERLLEGYAFLAARVQLKLDAQFPAFTQHLLELVYPHYLAPTPSMGIAQFTLDPEGGRLEKGYTIPAGTTLVGRMPRDAITACEFRTAHEVHLWPIAVASADYYATRSQVSSLQVPEHPGLRAALRLRLRTTNGMPFDRLALKALPIFLAGAGGVAGAIIGQLLADCVAVVLQPPTRPLPWREVLSPRAIRQVGLGDHEAMLPYDVRSFQGYRLLHEYFALPERALFVEFTGLADAVRRADSPELEIIVLLRRAEPRLERGLSANNFALFASPMVNLFQRRADRLRHTSITSSQTACGRWTWKCIRCLRWRARVRAGSRQHSFDRSTRQSISGNPVITPHITHSDASLACLQRGSGDADDLTLNPFLRVTTTAAPTARIAPGVRP